MHRGLQANSPELLRLFEAADLFVLPTYADCLAVVLMEAGAAGLPVITTHVGGLPEAVVPEQSGYVIAPGDRSALHAALSSLVENPERRRRMSRAAFGLASRSFDAERNNRLLLDLVVEQAESHSGSRRAA